MNRKRQLVWAAAGLVLIAGVVAYRLEATVRREQHGWFLEFTHKRFLCPVCTAHVRRFEFNGEPIPVISIRKDAGYNAILIETPVGGLQCDSNGFRPMHGREFAPREDVASIGADELLQGWYEVHFSTTRPAEECFACKRGTPASWCLAHGEKSRWINPVLLDKFEW